MENFTQKELDELMEASFNNPITGKTGKIVGTDRKYSPSQHPIAINTKAPTKEPKEMVRKHHKIGKEASGAQFQALHDTLHGAIRHHEAQVGKKFSLSKADRETHSKQAGKLTKQADKLHSVWKDHLNWGKASDSEVGQHIHHAADTIHKNSYHKYMNKKTRGHLKEVGKLIGSGKGSGLKHRLARGAQFGHNMENFTAKELDEMLGESSEKQARAKLQADFISKRQTASDHNISFFSDDPESYDKNAAAESNMKAKHAAKLAKAHPDVIKFHHDMMVHHLTKDADSEAVDKTMQDANKAHAKRRAAAMASKK